MKARKRQQQYVIGIDEVGRGSLAGPVAVAAVALPQGTRFKSVPPFKKLRDSKKLTALQRELWSRHLTRSPGLYYAVARVYPKTIDRINIAKAANLAAFRAYLRLKRHVSGVKIRMVYLDGGLFLGNGFLSPFPGARTIIKGDEKITAIMAASVIAKVSRDRLMRRLAKKYPAYGFEIHKGYGTKMHFSMVRKHGPSPAHRLTFLA